MNPFKSVKKHISYWAEAYIFIPALWLCMIAALHLVHSLTGRPVIDDPGSIVAWAYNAIGAGLVMLLTGLCQHHLFGYRSQPDPDPIPGLSTPIPYRDDLHDAVVTMFLLCFFACLIFWR